jgi:hypothetical protein
MTVVTRSARTTAACFHHMSALMESSNVRYGDGLRLYYLGARWKNDRAGRSREERESLVGGEILLVLLEIAALAKDDEGSVGALEDGKEITGLHTYHHARGLDRVRDRSVHGMYACC